MNPEVRRRIEQGASVVGNASSEIYRHVLRPATLALGRGTLLGLRAIDRHLARPCIRRLNRELDRPMPTMSRRTFLKYSAAATLAASAVGGALSVRNEHAPTPRPVPEKVKSTFYEPFEDKDANDVAREIDFNAGTLFVVPKEMMGKLTAFLDNELYPIYPPSVMINHKDLIYKLSKDSGIAPNIIAMIMTIESAGYKESVSGAKAQGLFQVMPFHFENAGITDKSVMRQPEINGKFGMDVYKYFFSLAQQAYPDFSPKDPRLVARALMGYNGGFTGVSDSINATPDETAFYGDFIIRFIVIAEIAARLRKKGFSDPEIIQKLHSEEISRRGYALQEYLRIQGSEFKYEPYSRVSADLAEPIPWQPSKQIITNQTMLQLKSSYENYDSTPSAHLKYPFSPALELWYRMGGINLYENPSNTPNDSIEKRNNLDPSSWKSVDTKGTN